MSTLPLVDPSVAVEQATQSDVVRRKLELEALKQRLGDTSTKAEKLRDACEGFEAIFLQKMWEQMRKNVPKEGYLHSKDEETYQSLFDVELSKKMAGAGGIGLADMLYQQLSRQLVDTVRSTGPGAYRAPLEIAPVGLTAQSAEAPDAAKTTAAPADTALTANSLYSPLKQPDEESASAPPVDLVDKALGELRTQLGPDTEDGAAVRQWAMERARMTAQPLPGAEAINAAAATPPSPIVPAGNSPAKTAAKAPTGAAPAGGLTSTDAASPTRATENADADRVFGKRKKRAQNTRAAKGTKSLPTPPRAAVPEGSLWPIGGDGGTVTSHFGWQDDASGKRRWNSGVSIANAPHSPVRAIMDGSVAYVGPREGLGHTVVLEHKDGFRSYYSNLEENSLKVGDKVQHGSEFAQLAAKPQSTPGGENSSSLYFELKKGEMALNPENALRHTAAEAGMRQARAR